MVIQSSSLGRLMNDVVKLPLILKLSSRLALTLAWPSPRHSKDWLRWYGPWHHDASSSRVLRPSTHRTQRFVSGAVASPPTTSFCRVYVATVQCFFASIYTGTAAVCSVGYIKYSYDMPHSCMALTAVTIPCAALTLTYTLKPGVDANNLEC